MTWQVARDNCVSVCFPQSLIWNSKAGSIEFKGMVKFGILRKSALTEVLWFCVNAPDNFLEKELDIKRGVSKGYTSPFISFHSCQIKKESLLSENCK